MIFDVDDAVIEEIKAQDMHANDILDQINDLARDKWPNDIWHFPDEAFKLVHETLAQVYSLATVVYKHKGENHENAN